MGDISIAIGGISKSGPPEFSTPCVISGEIRQIYRYRDCDILLRPLYSFRRHVRFPGKSTPYRYRDLGNSTSGPPEFPTSCAILAKFGPYSYCDCYFSTSAMREFPTPCAILGKYGPYRNRDWDIWNSMRLSVSRARNGEKWQEMPRIAICNDGSFTTTNLSKNDTGNRYIYMRKWASAKSDHGAKR